MKKWIAILFIVTYGLLFGQENLTQLDLPQIGNSGLYTSFQQELQNPEKFSGVNEKWDYSALTNIQVTQPIKWIAIKDATKEQQSLYPNATYFEENNTGNRITKFFEVGQSSHKFLGFTAFSSNFQLKSPFDYYFFPMEYGKTYRSNFAYLDTNNGEGTYSIVYDGSGVLKLPNSQYDSVYRVKLQTKTVFPDDKTDTVTTNEYQFFKKGTGLLLLKLLEIGPGNSDASKMYSFVYYVSPITNVDMTLSQKIILYPNPAIDNIRFELPNKVIISYEIMDLSGKVVSKAPYSNNINISNLNSGNYFIKGVLPSGKNIIKQFIKK